MIDCLFCRIVLGEVPADIVYSDENVLAFRDIQPIAPVHVLVVPRRHIASYSAAAEEDAGLLGKLALTAARVAQQEGVAESGYRTMVNTGPDAQQSVHHLHLHVLGGRQFGWPPG
ncbi:MAG: histidine triad nucleotide-binding protein [Chloroflexota bacterium]